MADTLPTIHIEAVQFTPGLEPVLIHCAIGETRVIVSSTQRELGWLSDDPQVVARAELGVFEKLGARLKVKLPTPVVETPPAPAEKS